jgi:hypothetical protein
VRPFADWFPGVASAEQRHVFIETPRSTGLAPGAYAIEELYCDTRGCDCRMALLRIHGGPAILATIVVDWHPHRSGPSDVYLTARPGTPQTVHAAALCSALEHQLDRTRRAELLRHYAMVRAAVDRPKAKAKPKPKTPPAPARSAKPKPPARAARPDPVVSTPTRAGAPEPDPALLPPPPAPAPLPVSADPFDAAALVQLLSAPAVGVDAVARALTAFRLGAAQSFDELLAPAVMRGIDSHLYQIETVRRVLRALRGRALLADEVGLGKTVEAMMILREYQLRGMARRALVLVPPALVAQ